MLNSGLVFILLAFNSALSLKKDTRLEKKAFFPRPPSCAVMKCPAVEQPVCARLEYRHHGNRSVHVVMINKCEMNYVKCHQGLEAIVVPMKKCRHADVLKAGNKRSKRELENDKNIEEDDKNIEEDDNIDGGDNNIDEDVNEEEMNTDCPTSCPSRDVMVCAACQHGVYRTFLSTCHMRMYGCHHTGESLQLVSRLPCVLSAPYLQEAAHAPGAGRVSEPSDTDRVLRFIRCRELSDSSRAEDSRCNS